MAREIHSLTGSLQNLITRIRTTEKIPADDPLHIFYPHLATDIAICIIAVDAQMITYDPSRPPPFSSASPRSPLYPPTSRKMSLSTKKVHRSGQVTVYSNEIGMYGVYISRPAQHRKLDYPGLVKGGSKVYKQGVRFYSLREIPPGSNHFEIEYSKQYLSLKKSSLAYEKFLEQLAQGVPFEEALIKAGFDPAITHMISRPSLSHPDEIRNILLVENRGDPLSLLPLARDVVMVENTEIGIANAILVACRKNSPAMVPFDTKLDNIVCFSNPEREENKFEFFHVDWSTPNVTLYNIPDSFFEYLDFPTTVEPLAKIAACEGIYMGVQISRELNKKLSNKPNLPTYLEAALRLSAEEIVSAFICLFCTAPGGIVSIMETRSRLEERMQLETHPDIIGNKLANIEMMKESRSTGGLDLPSLFIEYPQLSRAIGEALDVELTQIQKARAGQPHLGRHWILMLNNCYFLP